MRQIFADPDKLEDKVFTDDLVTTNKKDFNEKNKEEKVDDVVNNDIELVEENDHDEGDDSQR